jgi:hypothetical protein
MNNIQERQTSELLNQPTLKETHFHRANLSEVSSTQIPVGETTPPEVTVPNTPLLLIPMSFIGISWAVMFLMQFNFNFSKPFSKNLKTIKNFHQIPCSSCRFFKNNPYLKCAVHPLKVSSAEAINCSDYKP